MNKYQWLWDRFLNIFSKRVVSAPVAVPPLPARIPLPMFPANTRAGFFGKPSRISGALDWFGVGMDVVYMRSDIAEQTAARTLNTARFCRGGRWFRNKRVPS